MFHFAFWGCFPENSPKTQTSFPVPAGAGDAEAAGAEELSGSTDRRLKLAVPAVAMEQTAPGQVGKQMKPLLSERQRVRGFLILLVRLNIKNQRDKPKQRETAV